LHSQSLQKLIWKDDSAEAKQQPESCQSLLGLHRIRSKPKC
jgi:hypothetical protein